MTKKYNPECKVYYESSGQYTEVEMVESKNGKWVSLEAHEQTVRDLNKLQKKLKQYENN